VRDPQRRSARHGEPNDCPKVMDVLTPPGVQQSYELDDTLRFCCRQ
jgi:hypothetical protein